MLCNRVGYLGYDSCSRLLFGKFLSGHVVHSQIHKWSQVNSVIRTTHVRWRSWLRHCATSRKVAGSIPEHNPSGRTMALGVDSGSNRNEYREYFVGGKGGGCLNLLQPSRSVQACTASNPITGLDRPLRFQEIEAPRFLDNRQMKVVRLSALRTGRLYPTGNIPGTHFC
jgi:hypothetical protein